MKLSTSLLAVAAAVCLAFPVLAAPTSARFATPASYSAATAPDAVTRAILERPLRRLADASATGLEFAAQVHSSYPQAIEQGFASKNTAQVASLLDSMSDKELLDLAYLYDTALSDAGRPGRLLDVLALRLDSRRLGRVANHFGFAPVYAAVARHAPAKTTDLLQAANVNSAAPMPHSGAFGLYGSPLSALAGSAAFRQGEIDVSLGYYLTMTPTEIYSAFRVGRFGTALGVTGSLYETGVIISGAVSGAAIVGWTIGTALAPVVQHYMDPYLYQAIGGLLYDIFNPIISAYPSGSAALGQAESSASTSFGVSSFGQSIFESSGGDFGVVREWSDWAGGGGGGGNCDVRFCDLY